MATSWRKRWQRSLPGPIRLRECPWCYGVDWRRTQHCNRTCREKDRMSKRGKTRRKSGGGLIARVNYHQWWWSNQPVQTEGWTSRSQSLGLDSVSDLSIGLDSALDSRTSSDFESEFRLEFQTDKSITDPRIQSLGLERRTRSLSDR